MVLKTAPKTGISMLSGVAPDHEVAALAERFSTGELTRMMNLLQQTVAGFSKSASRRMDAELCIVNLCQPELNPDTQTLISRLTRLEDQVKAGVVSAPSTATVVAHSEQNVQAKKSDPVIAGPVPAQPPKTDEAPIGFWTDVAASIRSEMKTPAAGFFTNSEDAPVRGVLQGDTLYLVCVNAFTMEIINKPDVLSLVQLKASAKLGRQVRVAITDKNMPKTGGAQMEQLLAFGRDHADRVNIK